MTDNYHVFLSHSRNDSAATADLYAQLRRHDLDVFKDDESIEPGDVWLDRLQSVLEGCGAFVVLVGRDGVRRWIGAETQVALNRHFAPHDDAAMRALVIRPSACRSFRSCWTGRRRRRCQPFYGCSR